MSALVVYDECNKYEYEDQRNRHCGFKKLKDTTSSGTTSSGQPGRGIPQDIVPDMVT